MTRRGFTAIELAIVMTITAMLVPLCFMYLRGLESDYRSGLVRAQATSQMRGLSEELRHDLRSMRFENATSTTLIGEGPCSRVDYAIGEEGVLFRRGAEGCGATRPVARGVQSLKAIPAGLEVIFASNTGGMAPFTTRFVFGASR